MFSINLLPPEIKNNIKKSKQTANIFSICLVATIVLVVATFLISEYKKQLLQTKLDTEKGQLDSASKSLSNFSDLSNEAVFLTERGKLAIQIDSTRPNWAQVLDSMINSVPENVQFISLNSDITKSPNFVLQGSTTGDRDAIKFKDKLTASPFFKDVAFKSSTADTSVGSTTSGTIKFSLEFNLAQYSAKQGTK